MFMSFELQLSTAHVSIDSDDVLYMEINLIEANERLSYQEPEAIIQSAYENFGNGLVLASSFGAESAIMIHMVTRIVPKISVVFVDTGYHFGETLIFMRQLVIRFKLKLCMTSSIASPAEMEAIHGKLWEQGDEGRALYQKLRKLDPMKVALKHLKAEAVIFGVRAEQTAHRSTLRILERNEEGISHIHPILNWTRKQAHTYMVIHNLPFHPLVSQGYESIGDIHSTVRGPGRSGRILGEKMECGLHLRSTAATNKQ
jgi:phosphoadenosine phosphosulfate reductase